MVLEGIPGDDAGRDDVVVGVGGGWTRRSLNVRAGPAGAVISMCGRVSAAGRRLLPPAMFAVMTEAAGGGATTDAEKLCAPMDRGGPLLTGAIAQSYSAASAMAP